MTAARRLPIVVTADEAAALFEAETRRVVLGEPDALDFAGLADLALLANELQMDELRAVRQGFTIEQVNAMCRARRAIANGHRYDEWGDA